MNWEEITGEEKAARAKWDSSGCRWERSEWPHPKFPKYLKTGLFPDVIWIRFHIVFRGGMMEDVTGWSSIDPSENLLTE